ncbi:MAG: hypothetical protein HOC70_06905 [Gammaproteobacteria bacterium]|jgi:hypothetical protein|nr:hypothetical protein [Gammaproteobacteria bacterium]MBT4492956.1 hypothetical protein [Gammaproteobacteria bacterium]MBT7370428.1 hypothetical protein [Gammaproteobacteria bacterium]
MDDFITEYQYLIAWGIYIGFGFLFCLFWWKITSGFRHAGWKDLLRGITVVVIFTPWYVSAAREHAAPAAVVVALDLMLGSTDNGLAGSLALLVATAIMLMLLIVRRLRGRPGRQ